MLHTMNACNEFCILSASQTALQPAAKPHGPGHPAVPPYRPLIRVVYATNNTQQSGFTGAITPNQTHTASSRYL